ncbi:AIM24 family protein [Embleya sp. NBC_00896]|uniref:AIM24 family protein n=1 Tax=Embleya sp. NBC_00896 TaxID=2975961 RepID=UPI0038650865|nr:AIM24 family protein [Embleya sp. NBC_00896]
MDQQLIQSYGQTAPQARMSAHGNKICRVNIQQGSPSVLAKQGSMIAYEGWVTFQGYGQGRTRRMTGAMTGERMQLMLVEGQGDVYLADYGADIAIMQLNGEALSVNAANILAFDANLTHSIKMVSGVSAKFSGNGLYNMEIQGEGWVAITTRGTPVVLNPGERETYVDPDALVAWSTSLKVGTKRSMRMGGIVGRGSGEAMQVSFKGTGFVVVQPAEDATDRFHVRG